MCTVKEKFKSNFLLIQINQSVVTLTIVIKGTRIIIEYARRAFRLHKTHQ